MAALLIFGGGGHGKVVATIAAEAGSWDRIAFVDDRHAALERVADWEVLSGFDGAADYLKEFTHFFVAVGDNALRLKLLNRYREQGHRAATLVHGSAWVSASATFGAGTLIGPQAAVHTDARLGLGCIVNTAATVDHDCVLEDGVHLSPGVHLAGEVKVGRETSIGIGSAVCNRIDIGHHVIIGAGSAVIESVPDGVTATGVPARILKQT
ncbi:acetyltransferase [Nitrospina watsonii]|uniref:UDP-N-acetylbacillosamine N-acetyltransferase n=1 Tax=Nitrospina watsonii TaxID=1323948 RepID=A0ABM9H9Y7_9BACT|nr:acetyltransferase [Nitrospina watsonii]CAI2716964.1 UDP-N-acetylbacillosamine N-acetyltransferase [Nitrospina watsonii]